MSAPERYGASPDEWRHFAVYLGLRADLLPVVSNPDAVISPHSKMSGLGKTPSIYNRNNQVVGIPQWTGITASSDDINRWSKEPDYGICIQTRRVRAIDIDVLDREHADRILRCIDERAPGLPHRTRSNSSKCLVIFECAGDLTKRKFETDHGIVEFLAGGQQFIAVGTHPSGARYEWLGGLPEDIPCLDRDTVEALWSALIANFAIEDATEVAGTERHEILKTAIETDPVVAALDAAGLIQSRDRDGKLHITCPFADGHTGGESKGSSTSYFPAHTGGYERGHFSCLHASCAGRTDTDFLDALGLIDDPADDFDVITSDETPAPAKPAVVWPGAIDLCELATDDPEPPAFVIPDWLPEGMATLFAGHGGAGKSGIALHLSACISLGREFFGLQPSQRKVLYLSCEDRASMLHWRLHHVCNFMGVRLPDLTDHLYLLDLVGKDSLLYNRDPRNGRYMTEAFKHLRGRIVEYGAEVIVVDGISDTFAGNENSRGEVKQFVNMLVDAIPQQGAVVLVGHVAKPAVMLGAKTPDGYSGSTGWHNSVRARWYLHPEQDTSDDVTKSKRLILALQKSNYGRTDQSLAFEWDQDSHLFVGARQEAATPQERASNEETERREILKVVAECCAKGVKVPAAMQGPNTAIKFLRVNDGWPAGLRSERREVRDRARDHLHWLVQQGYLTRNVHWTDNRNAVMAFEVSEQGSAWIESDDLSIASDELSAGNQT